MTPVQKDRLFEKQNRYMKPSLWIQVALLVVLLLVPLLPSFRIMDMAAKIMIFTVVVASYDLILGYTGLLSFAHAMFFGIGAYSVALLCYHSGSPQWYHLILAAAASLMLSVLLALVLAFVLAFVIMRHRGAAGAEEPITPFAAGEPFSVDEQSEVAAEPDEEEAAEDAAAEGEVVGEASLFDEPEEATEPSEEFDDDLPTARLDAANDD